MATAKVNGLNISYEVIGDGARQWSITQGGRLSKDSPGIRELAKGLAVWWISGGISGLMGLGMHYCAPSLRAAWNGGMEAVVALAEWSEVLDRNPANRQPFLDQDPKTFMDTMDRWMAVYCACSGELVPGVPDDRARHFDLPVLVFRSGKSDYSHPRFTSEQLADLLPNSRLVEPPWPDTEWNDRHLAGESEKGIFRRWPLL